MKIELMFGLPPQAIQIRKQVFVEEQGFRDEFDETDEIAAHLVLYRWGKPVGVCRVYEDTDKKIWIMGRLAVLAQYRGRHYGEKLVRSALEYVRGVGGTEIHLHAQCRARGFYEKQGFTPYGEIQPEEGCPHIWMKIKL